MSYNPDGIGLRLEGLPTNIERYYRILADEGCHPKAAERIINRIIERGYDLLTVQSTLNFDWIREELEKIGVIMKFIEPLNGWYEKYDDGEWPEEALPERFRKKKLKNNSK